MNRLLIVVLQKYKPTTVVNLTARYPVVKTANLSIREVARIILILPDQQEEAVPETILIMMEIPQQVAEVLSSLLVVVVEVEPMMI